MEINLLTTNIYNTPYNVQIKIQSFLILSLAIIYTTSKQYIYLTILTQNTLQH